MAGGAIVPVSVTEPDAGAVPYPMQACRGTLLPEEAPRYGETLLRIGDGVASLLPPVERAAVAQWLRTLYPHQLDLVLDPWRFSVLNKSRKIGATYSYAGAATLWGMLGEPTIFVSQGEDEACEAIADARRHADFLVACGSTWAEHDGNKSELVFTNSGGRIVARPHTNAGRSYSGNVILDEFAYHLDPVKVWDAAAAVAAMGYRMRVLSTPNGVGNLFHTLMTDEQANAGWRVMQMTLAYARAGGMTEISDEACWKMARGNPRVYDQLFGCAFLDSNEQYLPHALVSAASIATLDDIAALRGYREYAGCDIARRHDLFAVARAIVDDSGPEPIVWVPPLITCRRTDWVEMRRIIATGFEEHDWKRLCIDGSGLGMETSERIRKRHGAQRVEIVEFTAPAKEDLATRLFEWLQEGRIRLMRDDAELRKDLYSLRRLVTAAGNVRYDAARTKDGHADRAWALALAILAAARKGVGRDNAKGYGTQADLIRADEAIQRERLRSVFDDGDDVDDEED